MDPADWAMPRRDFGQAMLGLRSTLGTEVFLGHHCPAPLRGRREGGKAEVLPSFSSVPVKKEGQEGGAAIGRGRNRQNRKLSKGNLILDSRPGNSF
jgi:hypothetical protein